MSQLLHQTEVVSRLIVQGVRFRSSEGGREWYKPGGNRGFYEIRFRSNVRYWIASERWEGRIFSWPSRSAMVRATFKIRVYALALNPNLSIASSSSFWLASSIWPYFLIWRLVIWALQ